MKLKISLIVLGVVVLGAVLTLAYKPEPTTYEDESCEEDICTSPVVEENSPENNLTADIEKEKPTSTEAEVPKDSDDLELHPMAIKSLRAGVYPGGEFKIKETLSNGANYRRYVASYMSEGLEINGLLTVPLATKPAGGYPAVLFVHGYIPPKQYSSISSYPTYQARLARAGFVTYKPDLRGHDESEGEPVSSHYSEKYVIDTLNSLAYLKQYDEVNPNRLGYWGHSNGGSIGLRVVLATDDLKAASFWAGVVGSYEQMFETLNSEIDFLSDVGETDLIENNGYPSTNPGFWSKLEPYTYLEDIEIPIQILHGTEDDSVPIELSRLLRDELVSLDKQVDYFEFEGDDHNIGINTSRAWQMSIDFYDEHLVENVDPITNASRRVTKKPFGILIDPETSPVQPERFSGYHTGVDFEVFPEELDSDVEVSAICDGSVVYKQSVNGYGGVLVQSCVLDEQDVTVLYGHIDLASVNMEVGDSVATGEEIAMLGDNKSEETDGERKHLHLAIHKGEEIELAGYVSSREELERWLEPEKYIY